MKTQSRIIGIFVLVFLLTRTGVARDPEVMLDSGKIKVLEATELTYYGIDFSTLHLINPKKIDQGELIKFTFCPAWIERFDNHFSEKRIARMLLVENLNDQRYPFQTDQYQKNNVQTIVTDVSSNFNIDSLKNIVSKYILKELKGIGVSIVVTEFEKASRRSIGYITFFDIETRNLLYVVKEHGKAGGKGMTDYWFETVYEIWAYFIDDTYKNQKKPFVSKD